MSQKRQYNNWYNNAAGYSLSGLEMDVTADGVIGPLPWSRCSGNSSFSLDDESFLLEALSHLIDEKIESSPSFDESFLLEALDDLADEEFELAPSSPSSSHSSPFLLPRPQESQQLATIISPKKVKRSRLCQQPGCIKIDRGHGLCGAHGGGKRCSAEFCTKASRKWGLCTFHFRLVHEKPLN